MDGSFEVRFPLYQLQFVFRNDSYLDHIASLVQRDGLANYEVPTPSVIISLVRDRPGVVLDVGANTGILSLTAAAANPQAHVCAFEPLGTVRSVLETNIAANPLLAPRISVQPIGLSDKKGTFRFYETINDMGLVTTSSSLELGHAQSIGEYREHTIETETLDSWAERLGPTAITFMKVDVEGHEYAVLDGGRKTLNRCRPYIVAEVLDKEFARLNSFKGECDYIDFAITPTSLRQCEAVRFHSDGWNHLFCPAEKVGRVFALARELGLSLALS